MNAGGPTGVEQGPRLTPPTISLLTSSQIVETGSDERWYSGFEYVSDGCGKDGSSMFKVCHTSAERKGYCRKNGISTFSPYVVFGSATCSTWDLDSDENGSKNAGFSEFQDLARRRLLSGESFWLEKMLWGPDADIQTEVQGLLNPHLASASASEVTGGGTDSVRAFAALEDALGDCLRGSRGMIHMRPGMLTRLVSGNVVRREGNVWLTATDNIVVPGRGYSGKGPAGQVVSGTEWMYASSMVQIRRGPLVNIPETIEEAIDRATNDVSAIVERTVHAALDPECCVLAAEVIR
jgi:hypothetical protein